MGDVVELGAFHRVQAHDGALTDARSEQEIDMPQK
jgi:hypothetical protein